MYIVQCAWPFLQDLYDFFGIFSMISISLLQLWLFLHDFCVFNSSVVSCCGIEDTALMLFYSITWLQYFIYHKNFINIICRAGHTRHLLQSWAHATSFAELGTRDNFCRAGHTRQLLQSWAHATTFVELGTRNIFCRAGHTRHLLQSWARAITFVRITHRFESNNCCLFL